MGGRCGFVLKSLDVNGSFEAHALEYGMNVTAALLSRAA